MDKYVDVLRGWMEDPNSVSDSQLTANYRAAREAYPVAKPRSPSVWAGLDACFESCLHANTYVLANNYALANTEACIAKYDME